MPTNVATIGPSVDRRNFLKAGAAIGAGTALGLSPNRVNGEKLNKPNNEYKAIRKLVDIAVNKYGYVQTDVETFTNRAIEEGLTHEDLLRTFKRIKYSETIAPPNERISKSDIKKLSEAKWPIALQSIVGALHGITDPINEKVRIPGITRKDIGNLVDLSNKLDLDPMNPNAFDIFINGPYNDTINASLESRGLKEKHDQLIKRNRNFRLASSKR